MQVTYIQNYGADADGNRGIPMWEASLDDSEEEREEIARQIADKLLDDYCDPLKEVEATLVCDRIGFGFKVKPIDYMDLILPIIIRDANRAGLLELGEALSKIGYESKWMDLLTEEAKPEWGV